MCLAGDLGAEIELEGLRASLRKPAGPEGEGSEASFDGPAGQALLLFGETNGCLLAEVEKNNVSAFERQFAGLPLARIGKTSQAPLSSRLRRGKPSRFGEPRGVAAGIPRESAEILGQAEPSLAIVREANREGR
jgi:hypothetical protein